MRKIALVAALIMSVAIAAPAFAASTSSSVSETLSVNTSLTITGVNATVDFGAVDAGNPSAQGDFGVIHVGGNATTWAVSGVQSALAGPGGASIPASAFQWRTGGAWPGNTYSGAIALGDQDTNDVPLFERVIVPNGQRAGAYTGTFVITVTGS